MLSSVLHSKNSIKRGGSREAGIWYTAGTNARYLGRNDIPVPGSTPATIRVNALLVMYGEDTFNPPALPTVLEPKSFSTLVTTVKATPSAPRGMAHC